MNLAESFEQPKPGTVEFNNLAATISDSFNGILSPIAGYYKTEIVGFEKYVEKNNLIISNSNGIILCREGSSMVAKVQALFDKGDVEKQHSLESNNIEKDSEAAIQKNAEVIKAALIDQLATGKVGSLTVDPQYLDFEALECK